MHEDIIPMKRKDVERLRIIQKAIDKHMTQVEARRLMGMGLGFIDVHLLASARLAGIPLWTRDLQLKKAAAALDVLFP